MTDGQKYIELLKCENEYRAKMPHDVKSVEVVKTDRADYPEIIEIHWKSGGKSGIGNQKTVGRVKPLVGDIEKFCSTVREILRNDLEELEPAAKEEAEKTRPWTYILGVLDDDGKREKRYSWYESDSWMCYGQTDEKTLQNEIDDCRRFRAESTSRWHVYKRMRGSSELKLVY